MHRLRSTRFVFIACFAAAGPALAWVQPAGAFNTFGWHWADPNAITYSYTQGSYGTMPDWAKNDVSTALDRWVSAVGNLGISPVNSGGMIDIAPVNAAINCGGLQGAGGCTQCTSLSGNTCTHVHIDFWIGDSTDSSGTYTCGLSQDNVCGGYAVHLAGHELGHAWGLDHSCVYNSLMSGPQTQNCPKQQYNKSESGPQQDDIDGYHAIYPPPAPAANPHDCGPAGSVQVANLHLSCYP